MTGAQGRNNAVTKLLAEAIQKENAGQPGVYYIQKAEARSLFGKAGVQFPGRPLQDGLIHSVFDAGSPVNRKLKQQTQNRRFKRWFGKSKLDGKQVTVGSKVLRHGLDRRFKANGAATAHIGELLKHAIAINEADPILHEYLCFAEALQRTAYGVAFLCGWQGISLRGSWKELRHFMILCDEYKK